MKNEIHEIIVETEINAPLATVWNRMVGEISQWWPKDFFCLEGTRQIELEPHVGGRLFEQTEDGSSILWGTVVMIVPNKQIDLMGGVTAAFGGPSITFCKMGLESVSERVTKFRLLNSVIGNMTEEGKVDVTSGWTYLMNTLKTYCEI